jgi:hypothetical protein
LAILDLLLKAPAGTTLTLQPGWKPLMGTSIPIIPYNGACRFIVHQIFASHVKLQGEVRNRFYFTQEIKISEQSKKETKSLITRKFRQKLKLEAALAPVVLS